ncbi:MAG: UDP-N-acetylglucosamine 2-epimerase (non-hydrolyzing) [Candidatus Eremiobacteraeota bacterium]|nr:UDP-N-acetylglucosamine 2-epimerase (non-hydrolyzing) [Candidatus Eremiobacteraeota bacterium]MBC5828393.1 UDP-N-acetylglucosamine 2-epimerase (non-hydrolyzing) [Candidatus Eremiobacteraeota bacterium]
MAPVLHALSSDPRFVCVPIATAQHRQMLDEVLSLFEVKAEYDLEVMTEGQTLTDITTRVLERIAAVLADRKPDVVLVHGDTTTSTSAALAAFYQKIPVGHVEAGLRTDTVYEPFPEEMNRRITGIIATHHFAPTPTARANLLKEGKAADTIVVTGNTVIDALLWVHARLTPTDVPVVETARLLFVEAHRRENLGAPMEAICRALKTVMAGRSDLSLIWPVHPNPEVVNTVRRELEGQARVRLVPPLGYRELIGTLGRSTIIVTDSGGLQEEGPCLGKPVLVLRRVTERPEGVAAGTLQLVGTDEGNIKAALERLLDDSHFYDKMARAANPYGDGRASGRIADSLWAHYRGGAPPAEFDPSLPPLLPVSAP